MAPFVWINNRSIWKINLVGEISHEIIFLIRPPGPPVKTGKMMKINAYFSLKQCLQQNVQSNLTFNLFWKKCKNFEENWN